MGTGKTTLGRALPDAIAAKGWERPRYVDLDDAVEQHEQCSISQLFANKGEDYFRRLEAALLRNIATDSTAPVIVGCGGGTPCHSSNMQWMNQVGTTVLLKASTEVLLRRLLEAQSKRPLIAGLSVDELSRFIDSKQQQRAQFYEQAQFTFPSNRLESAAEIEQSCDDFIKMLCGGNCADSAALCR